MWKKQLCEICTIYLYPSDCKPLSETDQPFENTKTFFSSSYRTPYYFNFFFSFYRLAFSKHFFSSFSSDRPALNESLFFLSIPTYPKNVAWIFSSNYKYSWTGLIRIIQWSKIYKKIRPTDKYPSYRPSLVSALSGRVKILRYLSYGRVFSVTSYDHFNCIYMEFVDLDV